MLAAELIQRRRHTGERVKVTAPLRVRADLDVAQHTKALGDRFVTEGDANVLVDLIRDDLA